jgi:hypothetical protein
LQKH